MRVLVGGASGLVGTHLMRALLKAGHEGVALVRRPVRDPDREIYWKPSEGELNPDSLVGFDAVAHLGGASLAGGRWSEARKQLLWSSRVDSTRLLAQAVADLPQSDRPSLFLSASAVGYYGDRGEEELDEFSSPGEGFLADLCLAWEGAAKPAEEAGVRVVHPRFGLVLAAEGGLLTPMRLAWKLGLGARLGSGRQLMSWVHMDDVVGALLLALEDAGLEGAMNVVSPRPVTNRRFTKTLAEVLHRPAFFALPGWLLELVAGREMAREMLLVSQNAVPRRLLEHGYDFHYPTLQPALMNLLSASENRERSAGG
jgi:uncharacterized protein (TIGR01777 family)